MNPNPQPAIVPMPKRRITPKLFSIRDRDLLKDLEIIEQVVLDYSGLNKEEFRKRSHRKRFVRPRQVFVWLASKLTDGIHNDFALYLNMNRASAHHCIRTVSESMACYPSVKQEMEELTVKARAALGMKL